MPCQTLLQAPIWVPVKSSEDSRGMGGGGQLLEAIAVRRVHVRLITRNDGTIGPF